MINNGTRIQIQSRPYFPVMINRKGPFWFCFDTGSQGCRLSMHLVKSLDLKIVDGAVVLDSFELGGAQWTHLAVGTGDNADVEQLVGRQVDGFIGGCFLTWAKLSITVDYPQSLLFVHQMEDQPRNTPGNDSTIPIRIENYYPIVPVFINECGPFQFMIDTGASMCVVSRKVAEKCDLAGYEQKPIRGLAGQLEAQESLATTVRVGNAQITNLNVSISETDDYSNYATQSIDGAIGHSFLQSFVMTLDYVNQTLCLKR